MLEPSDGSEQSKALEYSDLYLEVAPRLLEAGLYQDALKFYQSIKRYSSLESSSLYIEMGRCFQGIRLGFKAEDCFQMAIQMDDDNIEARMELAKMYELLGEQEQAFIYVNEVMSIKRSQNARLRPGPKPGRNLAKISGPQTESEAPKWDVSMMPTKVPRAYKPRRLADPTEKQKEEKARAEQLQNQYYIMRKEHQSMRNGDVRAMNDWMDAARDLTDDFRSFKLFYPWDKYIEFLGYTGGTRAQAETPLESDLTDMVERLSRSLLHPHSLYIEIVSTDIGRSGGRGGGQDSDGTSRYTGGLSRNTFQCMVRYLSRVRDVPRSRGKNAGGI